MKASFHIPENRPNFPITKGFRMKISMKLVYQYIATFFNFSTTSNHFHPLQVENCDSNSRLVVDEDDNGKYRLERVNSLYYTSQCVKSGFKLVRTHLLGPKNLLRKGPRKRKGRTPSWNSVRTWELLPEVRDVVSRLRWLFNDRCI